MKITTRKSKGKELTQREMDKNLIILSRKQQEVSYSSIDNNYTPVVLDIPIKPTNIIEKNSNGIDLIVYIDYETDVKEDEHFLQVKGYFKCLYTENKLILEPMDDCVKDYDVIVNYDPDEVVSTEIRILMPYSMYGVKTKYKSSACWYFSDEI